MTKKYKLHFCGSCGMPALGSLDLICENCNENLRDNHITGEFDAENAKKMVEANDGIWEEQADD